MTKELMDLVLPRLAQRLNRHLRRYRAGKLDDAQFSHKFETLLQQQYDWLANKGVAEIDAAIAVHGSVLVLSSPGLKAEAAEQGTPLEIIEFRAIEAAAQDIAQSYRISRRRTVKRMCEVMALYIE
jgi:hypothetical protein